MYKIVDTGYTCLWEWQLVESFVYCFGKVTTLYCVSHFHWFHHFEMGTPLFYGSSSWKNHEFECLLPCKYGTLRGKPYLVMFRG